MLTGSGTDLTVSGDLENSGGTIVFEEVSTTLIVTGDFSQFIGTLEFRFSFEQASASRMEVGGSTSLSGTLRVIADDEPDPEFQGFVPTLISTAGSASGDFTTVVGPPPPSGTSVLYGWIFPPAGPMYVFGYVLDE